VALVVSSIRRKINIVKKYLPFVINSHEMKISVSVKRKIQEKCASNNLR